MTGPTIYVVQSGELEEDGVRYENVAAYLTPLRAYQELKRRKSADAYANQYDRVQPLELR